MVNNSKVVFFQKKILEWFEENKRDFPWRTLHLSNFELIIAEVLLQRTRAETVAKHFEDFIQKYSSWSNIYDVETSELEDDLRPLGLYKQRAKRLKLLAQEMTETINSLPNNRKDLESIPLIGQYIASAILVYIHNKKEPLLDVNMARLIERYFEPREKADIRYDEKLHRIANKVIDHPECKILNWSILDFASLICTKRNPDCKNCPLNKKCTYYNTT